MKGRALSIFGNTVVLSVLALGAWLWWRNVTRTADPPPAPIALLAETAERVGVDSTAGAPRTAGREPAGPIAVAPSGLAIPVVGIAADELANTFQQSRGGGSRVHNAMDIMAPRGTPVVSASDGRVEKLFFSNGGGGITAYIRSDDGRFLHYYAHLDAYAPGLRAGQRIRRGDPVGTVGISGNADPSGPHLHYAIHSMQPGERWWQGTPVNPYPLLAGARSGG